MVEAERIYLAFLLLVGLALVFRG
uniref:Uncharacterized protein n=1 Tax=Rhizophora mucronata TaxID=61149 RepID=A0A2P2JKT3_RHIMU